MVVFVARLLASTYPNEAALLADAPLHAFWAELRSSSGGNLYELDAPLLTRAQLASQLLEPVVWSVLVHGLTRNERERTVRSELTSLHLELESRSAASLSGPYSSQVRRARSSSTSLTSQAVCATYRQSAPRHPI